jgi:hemerythrin-like metal-binding protein
MSRIFILWNESYNVGIHVIDTQHKKLVDILNELYESFVDQTSGQKLNHILKELKDYTVYHFGTEEELFKKFGYPHAEGHLQEHKGFVDRIEEFSAELMEGKSKLTFQLMNYLKNWLLNHICGSDQAYVSFFQDKVL